MRSDFKFCLGLWFSSTLSCIRNDQKTIYSYDYPHNHGPPTRVTEVNKLKKTNRKMWSNWDQKCKIFQNEKSDILKVGISVFPVSAFDACIISISWGTLKSGSWLEENGFDIWDFSEIKMLGECCLEVWLSR